ncbi:TldD/PmbA family protein [Neorickettsia findlayensis]|uniref:TldD/PmbA family protein n=1 Tax=Neorickettsia findlayensis TaxID=2686014 RepID=A0A6P1GAL7_9RICK|nr:TldD/PmbA family protein [Neorickettsia findlayensis]QHD65263.1 TldD/PmbA family protein [Neorickettsia findlayensis]
MKVMNCIELILSEAQKRNCQADLLVTQTQNTTVNARNFEIEKLEESSFSSVTFRLIKDKKTTSVRCDPSADIRRLILQAYDALAHIPEDEYVSLPKNAAVIDDIYSTHTNYNFPDKLKELAIETEQIAHSNGKLKTTETIEFGKKIIKKIVANTNGFFGTFENQLFSAVVSVVAENEGNLNSGYSYITSNSLQDLSPTDLAAEAEKRAIEGLRPRKVPTCKREVIFDARCASSFLDNFNSFLSGKSVIQSATFLKGDIGKEILPRSISILNNPEGATCKIETAAFDDEGNCTTKRLPLIERGILKNWILDQYNANKLGLKANGFAKRTLSGSIFPSTTNIYLESSDTYSEKELISKIKEGLYVTSLFSCGVNPITGDYSQGVQGLWIENGELSFPVSEITIAGQLKDIFKEIIAADNIKFCGRANSPSLYLGCMSISGT